MEEIGRALLFTYQMPYAILTLLFSLFVMVAAEK